MNELFDPATITSPSPRLKWIERHGLKTYDYGEKSESAETGAEYGRWTCYREADKNQFCKWANGDTEGEAIAAWARKHGVRLWQEEKA